MTTKPFIMERLFDANIQDVWRAITEKDLMKQWYFDLPEFKAEVGFKFEFTGGPPEKPYIHDCEIIEVIFGKKLTHTWRYRGYDGISYLTFELFPEGGKTRLKLTHSGIETFPSSNPDFDLHNFEKGWDHILSVSLKQFLEKKHNHHKTENGK